MKYSNYIGILVAIVLMAICFVPWVFIASINTIITGMHAEHTNFGRPGLMNIILNVIAVLLFVTAKIWAKRTNVFVCTFNLAWTVRNYIIITQCELGECPEKRWGIYALVLLSVLLLLMALLPKLDLTHNMEAV